MGENVAPPFLKSNVRAAFCFFLARTDFGKKSSGRATFCFFLARTDFGKKMKTPRLEKHGVFIAFTLKQAI